MDCLLKLLTQSLDNLNIKLIDTQQQQLLAYIELLEKWNRTFNLTAIRKKSLMLSRHIVDSLSIAQFLSGKNILDVGSGAGLPGIPLAIARPDLNITMTDCNGKKTRFMTQATISLKLTNTKVVHSRIESWYPDGLFDVITSRAFSSMVDMIKKSKHLIASEGCWLAMKGTYPADEINELAMCETPVKLVDVQKICVPGCQEERHLAILRLDD